MGDVCEYEELMDELDNIIDFLDGLAGELKKKKSTEKYSSQLYGYVDQLKQISARIENRFIECEKKTKEEGLDGVEEKLDSIMKMLDGISRKLYYIDRNTSQRYSGYSKQRQGYRSYQRGSRR